MNRTVRMLTAISLAVVMAVSCPAYAAEVEDGIPSPEVEAVLFGDSDSDTELETTIVEELEPVEVLEDNESQAPDATSDESVAQEADATSDENVAQEADVTSDENVAQESEKAKEEDEAQETN